MTDRKKFCYKSPEASVEREKSFESSSQAPGLVSEVAFFNLKSKI
ncbi:hypothetical protein AVDCRST_MAG84-588 [uncultured Microcoleus sp.]|uniref:Uncharacterized protein n=1 Tax=uncultured Microcoleus sp. TaxID=259945 RepID=A0A6J4KJR7_9CYAN|nr:hypothetical protein AVDCRST_MAG84-588 [uncultured Microcoleus sp.]